VLYQPSADRWWVIDQAAPVRVETATTLGSIGSARVGSLWQVNF